jgi:hypothetical protein
MPELSTILIVLFAITIVAVVLIVVAISKRKDEINERGNLLNQTELPSRHSEAVEPVGAIELQVQTTNEKEPPQPIDSRTTPSVDANRNTEDDDQRDFERTIGLEERHELTPTNSLEPNENPPANGLTDIEAPEEASTQLRNEVTDSDRNSQTKPGRKISPENRGGARREIRKQEAQESTTCKNQRLRKPELVCWQQARKWFVGIETLGANGQASQTTAEHDNVPLTKVSDTRWAISSLFGSVGINPTLTQDRFDLLLAEEQNPFLLFKLSGESLNNGRSVHYATTGFYLVVTPQDWIRDEQQSGVPQVPPSHCHLNGFQAHYFHLDSANGERIAFLTPEGKAILIPNRNSHFQIKGYKIDDANDEIGSLFGQSLLSLTTNDAAIWRDVETIVIGEEGKSANGWRTWFKPEIEDGTVDVLPYLRGKEAGWFFLRIYDSNDELIDSLDFRFARSLHSIRIDEHSTLPSETGHKSAKITLEYKDASSCELLPSGHNLKPEEADETKIEIDVPPQPEFDRTNWTLIFSTKASVSISLLVKRVWWTICKRDAPIEQLEWQDKSLPLKADHLKATSDYVLRIRLPKPRWTKEVHIGFERRLSRTYPVEVTKQLVDIPLNHFEGVSQLEDSSKDHPLFLWLDGFSQQIIALLSSKRRKRKKVQENNKTHLRLNIGRLLRYLNRLDQCAKDPSLSQLLNECRRKWSSVGIAEHRSAYEIETACVIALSWKLLKEKRMKVVGRRKGWIRYFIRIAESNPSSFSSTIEKYQKLAGGDTVTL